MRNALLNIFLSSASPAPRRYQSYFSIARFPGEQIVLCPLLNIENFVDWVTLLQQFDLNYTPTCKIKLEQIGANLPFKTKSRFSPYSAIWGINFFFLMSAYVHAGWVCLFVCLFFQASGAWWIIHASKKPPKNLHCNFSPFFLSLPLALCRL